MKLRMQTWELRKNVMSDNRAMTIEFQPTDRGAVIEGNLAGDAEIRELARLTDLQKVQISGNNGVTEKSLSELAALPDLEMLSLPNLKQLTNRGVASIAKFPKLKQLSLWYCEQVDDQAVPDLGRLTSLSKLDTRGTQISQDGREQLQKLLPKCVLEK